MCGEDFSAHLTARSREYERRRIHGMLLLLVSSLYVSIPRKTTNNLWSNSVLTNTTGRLLSSTRRSASHAERSHRLRHPPRRHRRRRYRFPTNDGRKHNETRTSSTNATTISILTSCTGIISYRSRNVDTRFLDADISTLLPCITFLHGRQATALGH